MNTSTLISSGICTATISTNATVNDDASINKKQGAEFLGTTALLVATTAVGYTINTNTVKSIQQKYSSAYVESLSDEELAQALQRMDLLIAESPQEKDVKTL